MESIPKIDAVYAPSEDVVFRIVDDEPIIVPLSAGVGDMEDALFTLNETGHAIWDKLDGKRSLEQLVDVLTMDFEDVTREEVEEDVLGFIGELLRRGLLIEVKNDR